MTPACARFSCANGLAGNGKISSSSCIGICVDYLLVVTEAYHPDTVGAFKDVITSDDDDDDTPDGSKWPTCLVHHIEEVASVNFVELLVKECPALTDPLFYKFQELLYRESAAGCQIFGSCVTDCDCEAPGSTDVPGGEVCIGGTCETRCRPSFTLPETAGVWCDPCSDQCSGGYCQPSKPNALDEVHNIDPTVFAQVQIFGGSAGRTR